MKHALLLSAVPVDPGMKRYCRPGSFVVACDAGYRNAERLGIHPDLIVGDFDSAPQPKTDGDTIVLPHVKDDTDTHYAAKWLLQNGYTHITMLGHWAVRGSNIRSRTFLPACFWPSMA